MCDLPQGYRVLLYPCGEPESPALEGCWRLRWTLDFKRRSEVGSFVTEHYCVPMHDMHPRSTLATVCIFFLRCTLLRGRGSAQVAPQRTLRRQLLLESHVNFKWGAREERR